MEADRRAAKEFLYANLYNSLRNGRRSTHTPRRWSWNSLLRSWPAPEMLPEDHQAQIPSEGLARTVADYIAGMTDSYIEQLWARCAGR